ncbi:Gfo/Idh/MocA family oxidoreductase [soil metagenome]
MKKLKFAVLGCGFWAKFQIYGWKEMGDKVELIALCDQNIERAEEYAKIFDVERCYDNAEELFNYEHLDFVDIITDVETHATIVKLAAAYNVPVICQKPMAPNLSIAKEMVAACAKAGVPFFVHENFRWQTPIRKVKEIISEGVIGNPFKAKVIFCSSFPVFENQPLLAELDQFILTDVGSHILDICRFLFGDAKNLFCQINSVNQGIKGEDVATVFMEMDGNIQCIAEMSYASILEHEQFPQTYILIEAEKGSLFLGPDFEIRITTREGTESLHAPPEMYKWLDTNYAVVHSSIVDTNRDILNALQKHRQAETTGEDNLKTVELVFASYDSADKKEVIKFK